MLVPDMSDSAHVCRKEALTWQTKKPSPALTKYHISGGLTAVPHQKRSCCGHHKVLFMPVYYYHLLVLVYIYSTA